MSKRDDDATNMAKALETLFLTKKCVYIPTGEYMHLISISPYVSSDIDAKGLYIKRTDVNLQGRGWYSDYVESPLVKTIHFMLSSNDTASDSFDIS
jgi:hypothetical protein